MPLDIPEPTRASSPPGTPTSRSIPTTARTGLVQSALGADGKPVVLSATGSGGNNIITDATSFCWWYHDQRVHATAARARQPLREVGVPRRR